MEYKRRRTEWIDRCRVEYDAITPYVYLDESWSSVPSQGQGSEASGGPSQTQSQSQRPLKPYEVSFNDECEYALQLEDQATLLRQSLQSYARGITKLTDQLSRVLEEREDVREAQQLILENKTS